MATSSIDTSMVLATNRPQDLGMGTSESNSTTKAESASFEQRKEAAKKEFNAQVVQGLSVSLSSGVQPMDLVYKAAVQRINEELSKAYAVEGQKPPTDVLQQKLSEDNSPEATAGRILNGALSFFDSYAKQNPQMDKDELAKSFVETVRAGFEKGYKDAVTTLDSLKVFDGALKSDIEKTYDLVSQGFDDFVAQQLANNQQTQDKTEANNGNDGVKQGTVPKD